MPVSVLQVLDDLASEGHRFAPVDQIAAAVHDHVTYDLLAIAELFNQVAQEAGEVDLQIDKILLQEHSHDFDGGEGDFEVYIRDELVDEAQEGRCCLFAELLLSTGVTKQLH